MLKVCGKFHDVSSIDSSSGGKEMQLNNKEVEIEKKHIEERHEQTGRTERTRCKKAKEG